ncbi:MAG: DUF3703 domain-containing protein [Flavobacteriales bacterium]|nr:DUF3703 domain-containing protein [Flavobacteriales bacterium]
MKLHWTMPARVRPHYLAELRASEAARAMGNLELEWHHLERAHILGQRWPMEHNAVHWRMLQFGFRVKDTREILGQLPRLIFGGVKSFVGTVPIGNTGGANVPPLQPMPVPDDLARMLEGAQK